MEASAFSECFLFVFLVFFVFLLAFLCVSEHFQSIFLGKFCERQACVHKQSEQDASAKREATENESAKHKAQGSKATENARA